MTAPDFNVPDIVGDPPYLSGKVCNALISERIFHNGELYAEANVIYLKADETWHRLFLDVGIIHWRPQDHAPQPFVVTQEDLTHSHFDIAEDAHLIGVPFSSYDMQANEAGCSITFHFQNGRRVVFDESMDRTRYAVI
jgi:hypothetical protein